MTISPTTASWSVQLSELVGRELELTTLSDLLLKGARLLTITGPGGVGKTVLARTLLQQAAALCQSPHHILDLTSFQDAHVLHAELARRFGLSLQNQKGPLDILREHLHDRPALVLLDGAEHLDSGAEAISALLEACSSLQVVVTTRKTLDLRLERVWRLAPLHLPSRDADAAQILQSSAVALFIQRAHERAPEFLPDSAVLPDIAELVRRLDGLPLAIELVAHQVSHIPLPALLHHLDVALPSGGNTDTPLRHQSLDALARWSEQLLSPNLQTFFYRLGVWAGPFLATAAGEVAAADELELDAHSALMALVEHNLVMAQPDGQFRLLDTLKQFAYRRLSADGLTACLIRLAHYVVRHCEVLTGLGFRPDVTGQLDAAHEQGFHTLALLLREADAEQQALRLQTAADLCYGLVTSWQMRGRFTEGHQWCARLLNAKALSQEARARVSCAAGILEVTTGHLEEGEYLLAQASQLGEQLRLHHVLVRTQIFQANVFYSRSMTADGLDMVERALSLAEQPGLEVLRVAATGVLGRLCVQAGDSNRARWALERARTEYRARQRPFEELSILSPLADTYAALGQYSRAEKTYVEGERLAAQMGQELTRGAFLNNYGRTLLLLRRPEEALTTVQKGLDLYQREGHELNVGHTRLILGDTMLMLGRLNEAQTQFSQAHLYYVDQGYEGFAGDALAGLARVCQARGDVEGAWRYTREAWPILVRASRTEHLLKLLGTLAWLWWQQGDVRRAADVCDFTGAYAEVKGLNGLYALYIRDLADVVSREARKEDLSLGRQSGRDLHLEHISTWLALPRQSEPAAEMSAHKQDELFTERELDILRLLVQGDTNKRIARTIGLADGTVRNHLMTIFSKLEVTNRVQAVQAVQRRRLLD